MAINMTQLRVEVLEHLGIDATDLDATGSAVLDLLINRSFWAVCNEFKFKEKEQTATFSTIAGTRSYTILTQISPLAMEAIQSVSYRSVADSSHVPILPTSVQWYEENYNEQATLKSFPQKYFHNNGLLYLYPTPDQVYTITLWFHFILSDLSTANATIVIPQDWHEAIMYGAVQRGHLRSRDFNSATQMQQQYKIKINELLTTDSQEDALNKSAGARVLRPTYSVRH